MKNTKTRIGGEFGVELIDDRLCNADADRGFPMDAFDEMVTQMRKVYELYDRVTADDVRSLAKKYFRPENRTVVTLRQAPSVSGGQEE